MNVTHECAVRNSDLSGTTTEIYKTLMGYCHGTKSKCFPGIRHIMSLTNRSRRTIQIHLRKLEEAGLIITKHRTGYGGRYTSNEYIVVELMDGVRKRPEDLTFPPLKKTDRRRSSAKSKNRLHPDFTCSFVEAHESGNENETYSFVEAHGSGNPEKTRSSEVSKNERFAHTVGHGLRHYEARIESSKKTSNMFSPTEKDSLLDGEAAEIGHVNVILQTPSHSNPKPASVEILAAPVPVLPTVHENRPPAQPAPKPAAPTRSVAPAPAPAAPQKPAQPAPAPQARPAQPQPRPAQPAPVLTPTASGQAFAPRTAEPPRTDREEPQPTVQADRQEPPRTDGQEPRKSIGRYQIQGEFASMRTCVTTFLEFAERGWVMRSEGAFIAWIETWSSIAARSKQFVPEKKRIKNPKAYLVHMVKNGLDRTIVRQADVNKAQEVKRLIQRDGLYPVF